MSDWDELSPLEIDNARLRAELTAEKRVHAETLRMLEHVTMERDTALAALKVGRQALELTGCATDATVLAALTQINEVLGDRYA